MNAPVRFGVLCCFVCLFASASYGQAVSSSVAGATAIHPSYAQRRPVRISSLPAGFSLGSLVLDAETGAVIGGGSGTAATAVNVNPLCQPLIESQLPGIASQRRSMLRTMANEMNSTKINGIIRSEPNGIANQSTIDGLNSLATFDGTFVAQAGANAGQDFHFTMIGNDPRLGNPTVFPACIDEVSLQLLNADGSVFTTVPFAPFERATLESPNFGLLDYSSGAHIQYADAVHRAEFFNIMNDNWHTLLAPSVTARVTITVPFFVNVQLKNGTVIQARSFFTGTAADGSTFVLMLNLLFNFFFDNEVVNEINQGNFLTNGVNMMLFPNTFLFSLNQNNPNVPGGCCTLGFHTYFVNGTFPESRWVTEYASWISPGLFGAGFEDVTALSHETSEAFADPFVNNLTPNWQFPGQPANSTACQANLEEGDPIEVLSSATTPIVVKDKRFEFAFHPQNVALFEWFEMGATSNALHGAFSFPDETVLTRSAIPCP